MAAFNLPNEIWCIIFSYLPLKPKKNATATCKLWFRIIREDLKLSDYILISWYNMEKAIEKSEWNWKNWPALKTLQMKSLPLTVIDSREAIQSTIQKLSLKDFPPSLEAVLFGVDLTNCFKYFSKFRDMVFCVKYYPYTDQIIGLEQVLDSIKACKRFELDMLDLMFPVQRMTEYLSLRRRPEFFNLRLRLLLPNFMAENFHRSRRFR